MTPISQQIRAIISAHTSVPADKIIDDMILRIDFGLDEIDVDFVRQDVEFDLDLQITDDQWSDIQTVGQLVAFVEAAMKAKG